MNIFHHPFTVFTRDTESTELPINFAMQWHDVLKESLVEKIFFVSFVPLSLN